MIRLAAQQKFFAVPIAQKMVEITLGDLVTAGCSDPMLSATKPISADSALSEDEVFALKICEHGGCSTDKVFIPKLQYDHPSEFPLPQTQPTVQQLRSCRTRGKSLRSWAESWGVSL